MARGAQAARRATRMVCVPASETSSRREFTSAPSSLSLVFSWRGVLGAQAACNTRREHTVVSKDDKGIYIHFYGRVWAR